MPAPAGSPTIRDRVRGGSLQRRGVVIGVAAALGLCVLGCLLIVIAGLPAFRGEIRDDIHDAVASEVARQLPPGTPPGTYVVTDDALQASLRDNIENDNENDEALIVRITPAVLAIGVVSGGQEALYTGTPAAEDGRFVMRDMATESSFVGFLLPPDQVGGAIEDAINGHLAANNLALEAVTLADGEMTLVVRDA